MKLSDKEKATEIYHLTKTTGWQILEEWINKRINDSFAKLENIDETKGLNESCLIIMSCIKEKQSYEKLLKKINEYLNIYRQGE